MSTNRHRHPNTNPSPNSNDEEDDDLPIGRVLSRREVLALFGSAGLAVLSAPLIQGVSTAAAAIAQTTPQAYLPIVNKGAETATPTPTATSIATATPTATATVVPACVVSPALTEGPFFNDDKINRSDIRANTADATSLPGVVSQGVLLDLTFQVSHVSNGACVAYQGVYVDVWHADAYGQYSGESSMGVNTPRQNFLRGYQVTDANGLATFRTIYPGWYMGRAVHIHFKIRASLNSNTTGVFTSQLFFDDSLSTQVYATNMPYNTRGARDTLNANDNIYAQSGGQTLLSLTQTVSGYSAVFPIGVNV